MSFAQNNTGYSFAAGIEFQAYPTGLLPGLRFELPASEHGLLELRLGYNFVRHGDQGVHDDEKGDGLGFTLGYRYFFNEAHLGFGLGVRSDLWFNKIDWTDEVNSVLEIGGTSNVTVLQPTVQAFYTLPVGRSWSFTPTLGFGREINIKTEGEEVGEGFIGLIGLEFVKRY